LKSRQLIKIKEEESIFLSKISERDKLGMLFYNFVLITVKIPPREVSHILDFLPYNQYCIIYETVRGVWAQTADPFNFHGGNPSKNVSILRISLLSVPLS